MPYVMGGFPDMATSLAIGHAYADAGADLIELGIPFSDPLADGPVIHAAATAALRAGATVDAVIEVCRELSERVPVVVMCYANVVLVRTPERFAETLADAGASGLIVPDLPLEEAPAVQAACEARGLDLVPLVAPTTPDDRLAAIGERARGFLYAVSVTGTTGERSSASFGEVLARAKKATDVPVAIGFGIGTPEQVAAAAAAGADGVIVASRLVREAAEASDPAGSVRDLVRSMAEALR
jgi:tryptophan synthase alpha chain